MSHLDMLMALRALNGGEALFRPSSISRLLAGCLGSVQRNAHAPKVESSNRFTEEGTAAHIVGEHGLKGIRQPDEWTDRMVQLDDKGLKGWFVDAEMTEAVQMYLDEVASRWTPTTVQHVEQFMSLSELDPSDPILEENRGTGDCVLVDVENGYLGILDLKYGKGVMVPADSPQLKNYLLMAILKFGPSVQWRKLETVIVQPRALQEHERIKPMIHDIAVIMNEFMPKLVQSMYQSLEPDPPLVAGKHCKWCRSAANCPALQEAGMNVGADAFHQSPAMSARTMLTPLPALQVATVAAPKPDPAIGGVFLPMPEGMSPDDCATVMDRAEVFAIWLNAVKHQAAAYLDRGISVPGYKMVQRTGNRRWKSPTTATVDEIRKISTLNMTEILKDPEVKSPAQIEKLLKPAQRPLLAALVDRPLGGPTLVKESDKRQAVIGFGMGAIDFEDQETTPTLMGAIDT